MAHHGDLVLRHAVIHAEVFDRDAERDEPTLVGGHVADGGDLLVLTGENGAIAVLASSPSRESAESALAAATSRRPDITPAAVCGLTADGGAVCFAVTDGKAGAMIPVTVLPQSADTFERIRGIFETDVLRGKRVAIFGLGSGGGMIARELAMSGVGSFVLLDHDRIEVGNVCRHECDLADVGRLKTNAVADLIRRRNPTAQTVLIDRRLDGSTMDEIGDVLSRLGVDLVIGATDNRASRLLVNRICVLQGLTGLFAGVFRRAYGGQVLRVIPGLGPCYQCFVSQLPTVDKDREISTPTAAQTIAYSDRPVPVEPGLFSDVAPVALMVVKLAILELLTAPTTLDTLRRDLVAPLYLWLNRREAGTDYADVPPMETGVDGLSVLRWYGINLPREPSCPTCGAPDTEFSLANS